MVQVARIAQPKSTNIPVMRRSANIADQHRMGAVVRTVPPRSTGMAQVKASVGGADGNRQEAAVHIAPRRPTKNEQSHFLKHLTRSTRES